MGVSVGLVVEVGLGGGGERGVGGGGGVRGWG